MVAQLKSVGVDVSSVHVREDIASGVALIEVCHGENEIALDLGANETIQEKEIDAFLANAKPGDLFLTQGENNADSLTKSLQKAHRISISIYGGRRTGAFIEPFYKQKPVNFYVLV